VVSSILFRLIFYTFVQLPQATAKENEAVLHDGAIQLPADNDPYAQLVARAEAGDETIDFRALRLAYLKSAAYKRAIRVNTRQKLEEKIVAAAKAGAHEQVRCIALQILSTEYINLLGHKFLRQSCAKLNDDPCVKHNHFI
jgi:hypothetical protein